MIASGREKEIAELGFLKVKFLLPRLVDRDGLGRASTFEIGHKGFVEFTLRNVRGTFLT